MDTTNDHFYAVIMAGGGGTRLWPLSRNASPKQTLPLMGDKTLFQEAVQRLTGLFSLERVFVVTTPALARQFQVQCPDIPKTNYLLEPQPRGTASVVGLAAAVIGTIDPDAVTAILTSDHYIGNTDNFHILLKTAYAVAQEDHLVTLGITPTFPSTGFGYVQQAEKIGRTNGLDYYRVEQFKEKPDLDKAEQMIASGDYSWNSGMFVWKVGAILDEFERQMPSLFKELQTIAQYWHTPQQDAILSETWPHVEVNTIDYGIMEGAQKIAVVPAAGLDWNDFGTWESFFDILPGDKNGNIFLGAQAGETITVDTSNSLLFLNGGKKLVATIGLENLVIVDTGDALLIARKDQSQNVRQVVDWLKTNNTDYL